MTVVRNLLSAAPPAPLGRVLVVDDDEAIRLMLTQVLTEEGYGVVAAFDGRGALDAAALWQPDVIVLDARMPNVDGPSFVRAYHQQPGHHAPVIMCSASYEAPALAAAVGAAAAVGKPFKLDDLLECVANVISGAAPRARAAALDAMAA